MISVWGRRTFYLLANTERVLKTAKELSVCMCVCVLGTEVSYKHRCLFMYKTKTISLRKNPNNSIKIKKYKGLKITILPEITHLQVVKHPSLQISIHETHRYLCYLLVFSV